MSQPLSPEQLAQALGDAAHVARGDRNHDLLTALDVLAQDHRPDLRGPWVQQQLAYAVVDHIRGDRSSPIDAAADWCRAHRTSLPALLAAVADAVATEPGALERAAA